MMVHPRTWVAGIVVALLVASVQAQKLELGDPAPALSIDTWVKGEAVPSFVEGRIYVIEFWATWSAPCVGLIPLLSDLQKRYGGDDLTVIAVTSADESNSIERVREMVEEREGAMAYHVAWDQGRETYDAFMAASGQRGIPCSFLNDRSGRVAWIGRPELLEIPLSGLIAGNWNSEGGDEIIEAVRKRISKVLSQAEEDPSAALVGLRALIEEWPALGVPLLEVHYGILIKAGRREASREIGDRVVTRAIDNRDALGLNAFAWSIVDPSVDSPFRDLDLAQKAAEAAAKFSNSEDAAVLDTLARVWFWKQNYKEAVKIQALAVSLGEDPSLIETLADYQKRLAEQESTR